MIISRAKQTQCTEIAALERENFPDVWSESFLMRKIEDKNVIFLTFCTAENADTPIAYCILQVLGYEAELLRIAVKKSRQGSGIARVLLTELFTQARKINIQNIFLEVRASNKKAIGLYETSGFQKTGLRKNYYKQDPEDAVLMTKEVDG